MKKILLSMIVSLFSFLALAQSVWAIDFGGEWVGTAGEKVIVNQSGNTFSVETDDPKYSGIAGLKGTITGNTFIGQWYGTAEDCPNLAGYVPARGIISEGKIEVKIDSIKYNPETCVKTRDYEDSYSFVRVTMPTMTPQVEKKEIQQPKDANTKKDSENNPEKPNFNANNFEQPNSDFWTSIKFKEKAKNVSSWIDQNLGVYEPVVTPKTMEREPELDKATSDPTRQQWQQMVENKIVPGTEIIADKNWISIISPDGGHVLFFQSSKAVPLLHYVEKTYQLQTGEVEVKTGTVHIDIETVDAFIKSKGTHYWVSYDSKKKETTVGVYEGEVEVKSKDGKTVTIKPDGDKPGVVVVSKKLSVAKLVVLGLVLATVIGGAIMILRRKFSPKGFSKKKK